MESRCTNVGAQLRRLAAVDAVVPRNAQGAGFDGYLYEVASVKAVEVIGVDG